ncbi:unnamed protein product [Larinioides sclopetarius]|uniref:Spidroin N-terminal domain-containing protein n=1 Tax=Larinioides sclopetarius TaxID=280406 RepID=A0AAV2BIU4_9ARAC
MHAVRDIVVIFSPICASNMFVASQKNFSDEPTGKTGRDIMLNALATMKDVSNAIIKTLSEAFLQTFGAVNSAFIGEISSLINTFSQTQNSGIEN